MPECQGGRASLARLWREADALKISVGIFHWPARCIDILTPEHLTAQPGVLSRRARLSR